MKNINTHLDIYSYSTEDGYRTFDLTGDIVSNIKYHYGTEGIGINDRIVNIGAINFSLNNTDNKYTPPNAFGLSKNTLVILTVEYSPNDIVEPSLSTRFVGKISDIVIENKIGQLPIVRITATDFWSEFVNFNIPAQSTIQYDQSFLTGTTYVTNLITEIDPAGWTTLGDDWYYWNLTPKSGSSGFTVFSTFLDSNKKTTVYTEMHNLAISETGFGYSTFKNNTAYLNIEDKSYRNIKTRANSPVFLTGKIEAETTDYLIQEDGYYLDLDEAVTTVFTDNIIDYSIDYGSNLLNHITLTAYPRSISSGSEILSTHTYTHFPIPPYETLYWLFTYTDPSGDGNRVAGKDVIPLVPYVDYAFNSDASGSGTDYTSLLSVNTYDKNHNPADFGSFDTYLGFYSTAPVTGYILYINIRGTLITFSPPNSVVDQTSSSIQKYGVYADTLDQKYAIGSLTGWYYTNGVLAENSEPKTVLKSISFIPNNDTLMSYYMFSDIGDLVHINITESNINSDYYIQSIDTNIDISGVIITTWSLLEA